MFSLDYGTGYSSLAYLRNLPVRQLKIDKSFVMGLTADRDDEIIVRSTIELGHNMGLLVIAEGVEDEPTFERLRSLGCDMAQGYWLSRPLDAAAAETWMRDAERDRAATGAATVAARRLIVALKIRKASRLRFPGRLHPDEYGLQPDGYRGRSTRRPSTIAGCPLAGSGCDEAGSCGAQSA